MKAEAKDVIRPSGLGLEEAEFRVPTLAKWVVRAGCILVIFGFIYLLRAPLLVGIAEAWIVRQDLERADAIMLLGGGIQKRAFEAARLYREGYATKVIVADVELQPTDVSGITVSETELMEQVLLKNGVPKEAI